MTVTETLNKKRTTGNGVTVIFPAAIKIFANTDITVTTINNTTDILVNTLILNDGGALGYTVVFDTEAETLTVTVNTAPTAAEDLQILRGLLLTQTTDFPRATSFPAASSENAHDKNTMILQDQQEVFDRTLKLPEETSATNFAVSGVPIDGRALKFSGTTGLMVLTDGDPDQAQTDSAASAAAAASSAGSASTSAANAATSETNAAASATNAATSATNAAQSANSQIRFAFATSTTMADPGAGNFRLNNATVSSVTAIAFDATMNQTGFPDISDYLATWDDSTNTITGQLTLIKNNAPEVFALFNVTAVADNTGWLQITVAHVQSSGTFSASDDVNAFFARAGDAAGAPGLTLLATATAANSVSVDFTSFIDSTFDEYEIHGLGIVGVSNFTAVNFRTSSTGGAPFDSGASDYIYGSEGIRNDGVAGSISSTGDTKISITDNGGDSTAESTNFVLKLFQPSNSALETQVLISATYDTGASGRLDNRYGGGKRVSAAIVDAVQILLSSGNISTGEFKLYGVKK